MTKLWVYFNNALNALSALANNIAQCVFRNIFKYHNSIISKTHWTLNVEYGNISITHWDSQCVFEIFMYFEMYLLYEYLISTKTHCVSQNIANVFWNIWYSKCQVSKTHWEFQYIVAYKCQCLIVLGMFAWHFISSWYG